MDLLHLRYFRVIAECESISRAAEILHISQPALSKTMRQIQQELGVRLFDHVGRNIALNDNGKRFNSDVCRALDIIDGSIHSFQEMADILAGSVSILILTARSILPEFIVSFQKKYPRINLELANSENASHAQYMQYDFCITDQLEKDIPAECVYAPLFDEEFILCFSEESPLVAQSGDIRIGDISNNTLLTPWRGTNLSSNIKKICQRAGFMPKEIFECDNTRTLMAMVKGNIGISFMPISTVNELKANGLAVRHVKQAECLRTIYLLHNRRRALSDAAVAFEREIREFFTGYTSPVL